MLAITMEMENEDEEAWMSTYNLLTWKPVIYAANVAEGDLADDGESNSHVQAVRKYAAEQNSEKRLRRQQVRSIQILKEDLLKLRL